jgi:hypothetical protein
VKPANFKPKLVTFGKKLPDWECPQCRKVLDGWKKTCLDCKVANPALPANEGLHGNYRTRFGVPAHFACASTHVWEEFVKLVFCLPRTSRRCEYDQHDEKKKTPFDGE